MCFEKNNVFSQELNNNLNRLKIILSKDFYDKHLKSVQDQIEGADQKSKLSNLMNGGGNNGAKSIQEQIAVAIRENYDDFNAYCIELDKIFNSNNIRENFRLENIDKIYDYLIKNPTRIYKKANMKNEFQNDSNLLDIKMDCIRKSIFYLYKKEQYSDFFKWLFLFALLQIEISQLFDYMPKSQYYEISEYLFKNTGKHISLQDNPAIHIQNNFWELRRKLIQTAQGHVIIAGASLRDAFNQQNPHRIIEELRNGLKSKRINKLSILLTDPIIFEEYDNCNEPIRDINDSLESLQDNFYKLFDELNNTELHIYFLPLLQIDHAVITEEFMAFRSNKLWNSERLYKGNFMLHVADYYKYVDESISDSDESEYKAHKDYLNLLMTNSTIIYPDVDLDKDKENLSYAKKSHMEWRKYLNDNKIKNVFLHKVYEKQIFNVVSSTWSIKDGKPGDFIPNSKFKNREDLFNHNNLLGDQTQKVLLEYVCETEKLFEEAIKKHDTNGRCQIYPSLDLGFPNNVQRLAGGFATGMLVTWQSGTDIIPVDATVNICTSSIYKLDQIDNKWLNDPKSFYDQIKYYSQLASNEKGFSFSFTSGNHFLMIARDEKTNDYYLILHSSANELKHSYMGLYPVENNWYSKQIKYLYAKDSNRYFRYLKDEDARYFIRMVKNFQRYNEQIHQWVAEKVNKRSYSDDDESWMYHHYYMPTNQSIAIGTFAEPVGTQIPMFSSYKKPVYIFEIGENNWQVDLGGKKGKVCLVPHGWGQEIRKVEEVKIENNNLIIKENNQYNSFPIKSQEYIKIKEKKVRKFKDGYEFLEVGHNFINGRIIKTLIPVLEYSNNTINNIEGDYSD